MRSKSAGVASESAGVNRRYLKIIYLNWGDVRPSEVRARPPDQKAKEGESRSDGKAWPNNGEAADSNSGPRIVGRHEAEVETTSREDQSEDDRSNEGIEVHGNLHLGVYPSQSQGSLQGDDLPSTDVCGAGVA